MLAGDDFFFFPPKPLFPGFAQQNQKNIPRRLAHRGSWAAHVSGGASEA
jgi:hypothetical protein